VVDVSILIPTFRRPDLLHAAIESLLMQKELAVGVEAVVIDNDPARTAERVVAGLSPAAGLCLR